MASVDELQITVAGFSGLPPETRVALRKILEHRAEMILEEAGRLEAGINSGAGAPMITPAFVKHADSWQAMSYAKARMSTRARNWMIISGVTIFTGGFFTNNMTEAWGAIGFVACALIGFVAFSKGSE
jgi:hypothetical protein